MAEEAAKIPTTDNQQIPVPVPEAEEELCPKPDTSSSSSSPSKDDTTMTMTEKMTDRSVPEAVADVSNAEQVIGDEKVECNSDQANTFVPETNADHIDDETKALAELKLLLQNAIHNGEFTTANVTPETPIKAHEAETETETVEENQAPVAVAEPDVSTERVDHEPEPESHEAVEVKKVNIDEDGTKTVEAIEETVVSVGSSPPEPNQSSGSTPPEPISLWGIPLLHDDRTDTILWKFLQARDFQAKDAFTMLKNTLLWRTQFKVDDLIEQELDDVNDLDKHAFMHGVTKEGHPVCYNVYGVFKDKEMYQNTFSDEKKRERFLKWRVQLMERSVRKLDFSVGGTGISTIVQVNDLKDSPGPGKWELRQATKQALQLFQDNYPEFVAKQVFINVPWWYMAVNKMISPFLTQRTKSKFVVVGPSKSAETLFNYIAPEQVPVQYGGLSKEGEFGIKDGATHIIVKPASKEVVEFAVTEACHLTWEMRVLGWEVSYGAEFLPSAKDGYTVIIQKIRKVGVSEETIITNSFKTSEPGKVVLTIDNSSSKKKRLLYRLKSKPSCD